MNQIFFHIISAVSLVLVAAVALALGCKERGSSHVAISEAVIADSLQDAWLERRSDAMAARETQTAALSQARAELAGQRLGIQRDAAICLEARRAMDARLREAMVTGRDFAADLDAWHQQHDGVEMFCSYALTVGLPDLAPGR